jgi:hypothetical protein
MCDAGRVKYICVVRNASSAERGLLAIDAGYCDRVRRGVVFTIGSVIEILLPNEAAQCRKGTSYVPYTMQ